MPGLDPELTDTNSSHPLEGKLDFLGWSCQADSAERGLDLGFPIVFQLWPSGGNLTTGIILCSGHFGVGVLWTLQGPL